MPIPGDVLIVEDDPDAADLACRILTSGGFGVRWVQSREDALTELQRKQYEVIYLDNRMPGMSIDEFLQRCGSRNKILLVSALFYQQKDANDLGVKYWINKPYLPDELIAKIREVDAGQSF